MRENPFASFIILALLIYIAYQAFKSKKVEMGRDEYEDKKIKRANEGVTINGVTIYDAEGKARALLTALDYSDSWAELVKCDDIIAVAKDLKKSEYNAFRTYVDSFITAGKWTPKPNGLGLEEAFENADPSWCTRDAKKLFLQNLQDG